MKCCVSVYGGEGRGGEFKSTGEIGFTDCGFELLYELNGDKCELIYDGKTVKQTRCGEFNTEMIFSEGKNTACTFRDGDYAGELPVYTNKITLVKSGLKIKLSLDYDCGGESTILELTAEIMQEKK